MWTVRILYVRRIKCDMSTKTESLPQTLSSTERKAWAFVKIVNFRLLNSPEFYSSSVTRGQEDSHWLTLAEESLRLDFWVGPCAPLPPSCSHTVSWVLGSRAHVPAGSLWRCHPNAPLPSCRCGARAPVSLFALSMGTSEASPVCSTETALLSVGHQIIPSGA